MASTRSVEDVLKERTLAALKKNDKTIRERIVAEAKKQGYNVGLSDIKKIEFLQFVGLGQTVTPTFGKFATKEVRVPTFVDTADITTTARPDRARRALRREGGEEFNWSVTAGVTVGATVTEKVGVPGLSTELTMTMQMSASRRRRGRRGATRRTGRRPRR
jgi:hypothetical protein